MPTSRRRVLIAGCGYVGSALALRLASEGDEVFGLRRRPLALGAGVVPLCLDLARPVPSGALPRALDAVVYAVGADAFDDAAYRAAYVDGLRHLLDGLRALDAPPQRLVFVSSTAVYGQRAGERVDESSATEPAGFSGARVLEGERLALAGPVPAIVLRLGGIYGPGRTRLIDAVRAGTARLGPRADDFGNRIHRDDCAGALRHLLGLARPEPIYLAVDREPATERTVLAWIAERLGVPGPPAAAPASEAAAEGDAALQRAPASPARAPARPRGSKRCSSDRLVASGYVFRWPTFREGYGALIEAAASGAPAQREGGA